MRSDSKFVRIVSYVVLAISWVWLVVSGAVNLLKSGSVPFNEAAPGDVCEFSADYADMAFEVTHFSSFIPTGKDQFYLMFSGDDLVPLLVRAKPSWINKRFDADGDSFDNAVTVKGTVVRMSTKLSREVISMNNEAGGDYLNGNFYLDMRYKEFGLMRIISGIGVAAFAAVFFFGRRSGVIGGNKAVTTVIGIGAFAFALFVLYTLGVGGTGS